MSAHVPPEVRQIRRRRSPPAYSWLTLSAAVSGLRDGSGRLELREIRPSLVEKGVERFLRLRRAHARGEQAHLRAIPRSRRAPPQTLYIVPPLDRVPAPAAHH